MSDHNKKRIVMDGVTYGSIRAAGRAMAEMHGLNPETCACEISKATVQEGGGYVRGHEVIRVPDSADVCKREPKRVTDEFMRALNDTCAEVIGLRVLVREYAHRSPELACMNGDTCLVHGARIGYCREVYQKAVDKVYGDSAQ